MGAVQCPQIRHARPRNRVGQNGVISGMSDDILESEPIDTFRDSVQALVIKLYNAALDGIEYVNWQWQQESSTTQLREEQSQLDFWWEDHVKELRYHAGNMGLVSLITLFDNWMRDLEKEGREHRIFTGAPTKDTILKRFEWIQKELGNGILTVGRLEQVLDARNAIIHHGGAPEFHYRDRHACVADEFTDSCPVELRVAVDRDVLTGLSEEVTLHAELWWKRLRARLRPRHQ